MNGATDPGELGPSTAGAAAPPPAPAPAPAPPAPGGREVSRTDKPTHDSYESRRAAQDQRNRDRAAGARHDEAPGAAQSQAPALAAPPSAAADGGARIKVGDAEYSETEIRAAMESTAARAAGRPADANGYELTLPADFKALPGLEFAVNDPIRGPILQQAREFAHAAGLTQDQFSGMLALRAAEQGHEQRIIQQAIATENMKLGPNGTARVEQVKTWITAMAGAKAAAMVRVLDIAPIAATVEAFEGLMQKFHAQGTAPLNGGRDQGVPAGRIPGYATMTFEQRRAAQDARRVGAR
jgi:hypothetical protein